MSDIAIFATLCGAVIISYAAMGFSRKIVLLRSATPLLLLFVISLFLHFPCGLWGWLPIGTFLSAASVRMCSKDNNKFLILSAAFLSTEVTIAFFQIWALFQYFDEIFAWIAQITLMTGCAVFLLAGRIRLVNHVQWNLLWDTAAENEFRVRQMQIGLAQILQTAVLVALECMMTGIVAAAIRLTVCALFVVGLYMMFSRAFLISEISFLEDAQESSQRFFHAIRSQRHDFMIHVHTICGLLASKQIDACKEYVDKLAEEVQQSNEIIPLDDPAVSALLSEFVDRAAQQRVLLTCSIKHDMKRIACSAFELNRVLGNLLQNAMEEVTQYESPNRWIELLIIKRAGRSVIKVTNPFLRDPASLSHATEMNITTKPFHEGIGLKNIERIAKKYGGTFFVELDEQKIGVVVQIPDGVALEENKHENFGD